MNKLINPKIRLEESTHTYLLDDPEDISFTSVTTFIGQFFDEFDAEKIATKLVRTHPRYQDTTVDEVLAKWKSQTDRGTEVHRQLELYIKEDIYPTDVKAIPGVKYLENYISNPDCDILSEVILYSKKWRIAGTIDVILVDKINKKYYLIDWKTSKKIDKTSFNSRMGIMPETSHIMDCNYYHYALQLSMYSLLLEANYDIKPEDLIIVQLKEGGYEDYQLPNMKKVVIDMLNSRLAQDMS
jgi:ATP-dependent exoDNAse (exonuclease V) beta subunit